MLRQLVDLALEDEAAERVGAGRPEQSADRRAHRDGTFTRDLHTKRLIGQLFLAGVSGRNLERFSASVASRSGPRTRELFPHAKSPYAFSHGLATSETGDGAIGTQPGRDNLRLRPKWPAIARSP